MREAPLTVLAGWAVALTLTVACTSIEPGDNFVIPNQTFNADFFFCHVEPELIFAKKCGSGDPGDNGNCHFNSAAVSGMVLTDHPPVDCGGGDHPVNSSQVASGSPAQANLTSVSLEMSRDYLTAQIYVRPTSTLAHPRVIFNKGEDPYTTVISDWAKKP